MPIPGTASSRPVEPDRVEADDLLVALLEATESYEADPRYARWDGAFMNFINATGLKPALLGDASRQDVRAAVIDDLADAGSIRIEPHQRGVGIERKFALTGEGRRRARALVNASRTGSDDAVDLSWPVLQGRLNAFVDEYERAGAPMQGLPLDEDSGEAIHLRTLLATGYLEETVFGTDQRTMLKPTERALTVVRAWPSAMSMARDVVDEVIAELEGLPDPKAQSARKALVTGGRDLLVEILGSVLAKQSGLG